MSFRTCSALVLLWPGICSAGPPDDVDAQVRSLFESGHYVDAVELAQGASHPSAELYFYEGLALARLGRFEQARAVFQRGRSRYLLDKRFPLELAGVSFRLKHIRQAKCFLREALRLDPEDKYGNDFLGSLYMLEGNLAAALKYWNRIDKPVIQQVRLAPEPNLDPVLRERAIGISGGQIFTRSRLEDTEANLARLEVFTRRQLELAPRADGRFDLTLRLFPVSPPWTGWMGRIIPLARGLPYQALHFDRYNLAEKAINFQSLWRWDPDKRRVAAELSSPMGRNPRRGYRITLDARDENWSLNPSYFTTGASQTSRFKMRRLSAGGDLVFALNRQLDWTTGLHFVRSVFRDAGADSAFTSGWSFEQRNQFDYRLLALPEQRLHIDSSVTVRAGRVLTGAESRFAILQGDIGMGWLPPAGGGKWTVHIRMRGAKTLGRTLFGDFFQLGMERDNDLWLRGHVGTREGQKGNAPLGTAYVLLQTDLSRAVLQLPFGAVRAGPFFDAGWISGLARRFGSRGWLPDAGAQARLTLAGGLAWSLVYGRDLRQGGNVFYTAVSREMSGIIPGRRQAR